MELQTIINTLGAIGTISISSFLGAGMLKLIEHFLSKSKEKEFIKLANQHAQTMINYEKFIDKKYEIYPKINELFTSAESIGRMIMASFKTYPDYSSFTKDEINKLIQNYFFDIAEKEITKLHKELEELENIKKTECIVAFLRVYDVIELTKRREKAVNYYILNKIYLSKDVDIKMQSLVKKICDLTIKIQNKYQIPLSEVNELKKERQEICELQDNILNSLKNLTDIMRKELSASS